MKLLISEFLRLLMVDACRCLVTFSRYDLKRIPALEVVQSVQIPWNVITASLKIICSMMVFVTNPVQKDITKIQLETYANSALMIA